jgi:hypothetical protein
MNERDDSAFETTNILHMHQASDHHQASWYNTWGS